MSFPNSSIMVATPLETGGIMIRLEPTAVVDNVFIFEKNGNKYRRIYDGVARAAWFTDGVNNLTRLQAVLDTAGIEELVFDQGDVSIGAGTLNANNKVLTFAANGRLVGNVSNAKLNLRINPSAVTGTKTGCTEFYYTIPGGGGYSVTNEANNRLITSVSAGVGNAEENLTFDGSTLGVTGRLDINFVASNEAIRVFGSDRLIGSGGAGHVGVQASSFSIGNDLTAASMGSKLHVTGTATAASGSASAIRVETNLIASANGNTLIALDVIPNFTPGGFTGLFQLAARIGGSMQISSGDLLLNNIVQNDSLSQILVRDTLDGRVRYRDIATIGVQSSRTLTINGTTFDLSANRSWTVGDIVASGSYADPSWITSLGWSKITGRPTTLSGYGITDAVPSARTLTINGETFDLSANRTWNISGATTITNNTDNFILTATGIAGTINGEATLTFNGTVLTVNTTGGIDLPDGTTAQRPAITNGGLRFNSETATLDVANGLKWTSIAQQAVRSRMRRGFYYFNDFMNTVGTTNDGVVVATNSGTGAASSAQTTDAVNRPGILRATTGTAATGRTAVTTATSAVRLAGGEWVFETFVNIATLSNSTERYQLAIGFIDTTTAANQVDGVYFLYDEGGVSTGSTAAAFWQTVTTANSVRTFNTSLTQRTVAQASWVKLRIEINAAGTQVSFWINDSLVATHTGNIPSAAGRELGFGYLLIKSVGTTARTVDFDYLYVENDFTTLR